MMRSSTREASLWETPNGFILDAYGSSEQKKRSGAVLMRYGIRMFMASLLLAGAAMAQVGHPAKGSWLGYWGPDQKTQHRMVLNLDWRNRQVVGQVNPGPAAANVTRADIDYATWTMTLEATLPDAAGRGQKWGGHRQAGEPGLVDQSGLLRHLCPRGREGQLQAHAALNSIRGNT